jgi:peptidoglycan/xylan/chitin deacetylase (PgdA/CDA1 family)
MLGEYGIPAERFAAQLDMLDARGRRFVDLDRLLAALAGGGPLPDRATLVTFDDAYADIRAPLESELASRGIPSLVFAVSGQLGGSNEWDRPTGARALPLLDAEGLRAIAGLGAQVGSHTVSHRPLTSLDSAAIRVEVEQSAEQIERAGLPRPRALAYPYGEWNAECVAAAGDAGYVAAFTIEPGIVRSGCDPLALPRVEVLASDSPNTLRLKIATCSWPAPLRRGLLRLLGGRV